ncbi:MAG TPA: hypothetical protein VN684_03005 [Terriglobales bacterium]|nr:hypothetical protein [Terriglobales bacterium]
MEHFSEQIWADFVRKANVPGTTQAMDAHLAAGCFECKTAFDLWGQMVRFAAKERNYAPPENLARRAKLEFVATQAIQRDEFSIAHLIFDGTLQPLPAGIRSSSAALMQHFVYETEGLNVHLSFERRQNSNTIFATGQVLDKQAPLCWLGNAAVVLWSDNGKVVSIVEANGYGEFQLEFQPQEQLRLSIAAVGRKTLRIPLGNLE